MDKTAIFDTKEEAEKAIIGSKGFVRLNKSGMYYVSLHDYGCNCGRCPALTKNDSWQ